MGDVSRKLSIQVTSDNSSTKIHKTLEKFIEHKKYETYNKLMILTLVKKRNYKASFDNKGLFSFDKSDIWDYTDIIKHIKESDSETIEKIYNFFEQEYYNNIK